MAVVQVGRRDGGQQQPAVGVDKRMALGRPAVLPLCLGSETCPPFRRGWCFGYEVACPVHGCQLHDHCPGCGVATSCRCASAARQCAPLARLHASAVKGDAGRPRRMLARLFEALAGAGPEVAARGHIGGAVAISGRRPGADASAAARGAGGRPAVRQVEGLMLDGVPAAVQLRLDGFEGPLDLLLELARAQKVDLARISVMALADQYLAALEAMGTGGSSPPFERTADWLVMAAWLIWLKSRLLLPGDATEADGAAAAARRLADRLGALERIHALADWLGAQPQPGRDTWTAAAAEPVAADAVHSDLAQLMLAYLGQFRRAHGRQDRALADAAWRPAPRALWTVANALERIRQVLAEMPAGGPLDRFLPPPDPEHPAPRLQRRAALASTLVASLELARDAHLGLAQPVPFGEIRLTPVPRPDLGADT